MPCHSVVLPQLARSASGTLTLLRVYANTDNSWNAIFRSCAGGQAGCCWCWCCVECRLGTRRKHGVWHGVHRMCHEYTRQQNAPHTPHHAKSSSNQAPDPSHFIPSFSLHIALFQRLTKQLQDQAQVPVESEACNQAHNCSIVRVPRQQTAGKTPPPPRDTSGDTKPQPQQMVLQPTPAIAKLTWDSSTDRRLNVEQVQVLLTASVGVFGIHDFDGHVAIAVQISRPAGAPQPTTRKVVLHRGEKKVSMGLRQQTQNTKKGAGS